MAKKQSNYINLTKRQQKQLSSLWKKAQKKAYKIGSENENMMMSGTPLSIIEQRNKLLKMDKGYDMFYKDFDPKMKLTQKGYENMVKKASEFIQPDWEQNQIDKMINNITNAVKSVYGDYGNIYRDEDAVIGSVASKRASYLKHRLKNLSYDELLYITSKTDMLDVFYFYLEAQRDSEQSWNNLLSAITQLRKEYKKLKK